MESHFKHCQVPWRVGRSRAPYIPSPRLAVVEADEQYFASSICVQSLQHSRLLNLSLLLELSQRDDCREEEYAPAVMNQPSSAALSAGTPAGRCSNSYKTSFLVIYMCVKKETNTLRHSRLLNHSIELVSYLSKSKVVEDEDEGSTSRAKEWHCTGAATVATAAVLPRLTALLSLFCIDRGAV